MFRMTFRRYTTIFAIITAVMTIAGCSGSGGGTVMSGEMEVAAFTIEADDTVLVNGDLTIRSTGPVTIDGDLVANGDLGQSITIEAGGPVTVNGTIRCGNGAVGQEGGTLTIDAENQEVTLGSNAKLQSGNGAAGVSSSADLARSSGTRAASGDGQSGGWVWILADRLVVPDVEGVIQLGNGGSGASLSVAGEDLLTYEIPDEMGYAGGASGWLSIFANEVVGLEYRRVTLEEDMVDPETEEVMYPAGSVLRVVTLSDQITGGIGGTAGTVYYGINATGESTWPEETGEDVFDRGGATRLYDPDTRTMIEARNGAEGYREGGKGANIYVRGASGGSETGRKGQSVFVVGGSGGACGVLLPCFSSSDGCEPGAGGQCEVYGGKGGSGAHPQGQGGDGGDASAFGGDGGGKVIDGVLRFSIGRGGDAHARGGDGGTGGGLCPDQVVLKGGSGGKAGGGYAKAGNLFAALEIGEITGQEGTATAQAANGGQGGEGRRSGGDGGDKGYATAENLNDVYNYEGAKGASGAVCSQTTTTTTSTTTTTLAGATCTADDAGVTYGQLYYDGDAYWTDCGQASAWDSLMGAGSIAAGSLFTDGDVLPEGANPDNPGGEHCIMDINCP